MQLPTSHTLQSHTVNDVVYYSFPAFDAVSFVRHGFSTRLGGVSRGIYDSMNLSFTRGDEASSVRENFDRFCRAVGVDSRHAVVSAQEHHTTVYHATAADRGRGVWRERGYTDIDGLLTDEPDVVLFTQFADCVPLFFADPVRRVVGTAHAGWRGTAAGMGAVMIDHMIADYGCRPENVLAAIGPSIGPCCFEVDEPVRTAFAEVFDFAGDCTRELGNGKSHIDLWEINRRTLLRAGLRADQITVTDLCTRCHPDLFWSHRATGGRRGSLAGCIALCRE